MKKIPQTFRDTPLGELRRHPRNAKRGDLPTIRRSIDDLGFYGAVIAQQSTGYILAGNHRHEAAEAEGATSLPVIWVDVDEETATKILLVDNRASELGTTDSAALLDLLRSIDPESIVSVGFTSDDMDKLIRELGPPPALEPRYEDDDAPELRPEADSVLGGIYELGPHRLVCGSSTDLAVWKVLLQGEVLEMLWSDPPYGVKVNVVKDKAEARKLRRRTDGATIENDDLDFDQLHGFLTSALGSAVAQLAAGGAIYCAGPAGPISEVFQRVLRELEVSRHQLQWVKDIFAFGRSDYHYRHEPIFYGWKAGAAHRWYGGRTQDTVFNVPKPRRSKEHPTMKPVELIRRHLENSSRAGELVGDGFGGSGSTLIAAALTERRARLIELSPHYCDVIRRRWTRWAASRGQDVGTGGLGG